ncbi:Hypothetical protein NTJ_12373 [Nesidiocoris tenuis]|uniref:Uncharacterized protein n=1 Tax=Nesidiocoris tenuis TaxID=355587 RepID=A0ABN7B8S4_9HEMI|nr:Hypothetical protein NTJ_12373 [Nesidiocoris tenuis]
MRSWIITSLGARHKQQHRGKPRKVSIGQPSVEYGVSPGRGPFDVSHLRVRQIEPFIAFNGRQLPYEFSVGYLLRPLSLLRLPSRRKALCLKRAAVNMSAVAVTRWRQTCDVPNWTWKVSVHGEGTAPLSEAQIPPRALKDKAHTHTHPFGYILHQHQKHT